ncbi:MAG: response regulator [Elusimicrobiota bacterium]|jgi:CheY-like chemotaxis protein
MPDVIIFDDDPSMGDVAGEVLRGFGLSVDHFLSGTGAAQTVQETNPKLVVLDIMMQGMDGLSACRAIKSNPATKHVKVVIVTAKNFQSEQDRALRYGADAFLGKPFQPEAFARCVTRLLGLDAPAADQSPTAAPAPPLTMFLPDHGAILQTPDLWLICDAGARTVDGLDRRHRPPECWMLLSRYPEDTAHVVRAGAVLLALGARLRVVGPDTPEGDLQLLAPAMSQAAATQPPNLPLLMPQREGEFHIAPGVTGQARHTRYPGPTLAYRLELSGRRIVYCPWHQIPAAAKADHERGKFIEFFQGADVLIHGCDQGSGPWESVVDMAIDAGVKNLILLPVTAAAAANSAQARAAVRGSQLRCLTTGQSLVL